jgi:hypothetical protein
MKVKDLFTVKYGVNLELMTLETVSDNDANGVNFVARTAVNNGVVTRIRKIDGLDPQPAGILSCAGGGSVLSTFVQTQPFYSGRDLYTLTPKKEMSLQEKLYWCMCIRTNAYKYTYGRQANKTLKDIELPDTIPRWVYSTSVTPIKTKVTPQSVSLRPMEQWTAFCVGDMFTLARGKISNVTECENGKIPLVTAYTQNNGVSNYIACDEQYYNPGNCITVANTGQGSVFRAYYQPALFVPSNNVTCLTGKNFKLNKYIGLFITTLCWLEIPRYSYGRIVNNKQLAETMLKLPATPNGSPDWAYMEQYIKSLPYSDRI